MNDKLIDTFLAEASELIADLEKALLQLENDAENKEGISAVFRSMHTLKGAAGMFGFEAVGTITHHLESIYQDIRDGRRSMTEEILATTFQTLDLLRILLNNPPTHVGEVQEEYDTLLQAVRKLEQSVAPTADSNRAQLQEPVRQKATYYVSFLPNESILKNGTNTLYLVDDLTILGEALAFPFFNKMPSFEALEADASHMGFEVLLCTDKGEEEIKSVFIFVEDLCEIVIRKIADADWLSGLSQEETNALPHTYTEAIGFEVFQSMLASKYGKKSSKAAEAIQSINSKKTANIRVSSDRLDELMNLVSELVTTQAQLGLFANQSTSPELASISENIEKITRRLRDNAFTMSLVPLENVVVRFQRLVNDLSKELGKEIQFKAEGMDTKIDKSIIEKLTDPVLHLIRNSVDHGIGSPEERLASGKDVKGTVMLKSYYSGANVIIEISDDGKGINVERVRQKAIEKALIDPQQSYTEKELIDLIFLPGFSTASKVTGVSGRGVGMDVVKRNISDIRGEIQVQSVAGKGTTFSIKLPLTLSILDGLLVKIGGTDFLLPLSSIVKCYDVPTEQLETTYNQWITLEGERTPFVFLRKDFNMTADRPERSQIINVPYHGKNVGLAVDKIEGEYQAVLKPLGHFYLGQDEFSGATILGNGTVALVLDPTKVVEKFTAKASLN